MEEVGSAWLRAEEKLIIFTTGCLQAEVFIGNHVSYMSYIYYDVSMSSTTITAASILCDAIMKYKNKSWTLSSEKNYWSRKPQVLIDRRNSVWSILLPDTLGIPWWLIFIISHCRWANAVTTSRGILCRIFPEKQCIDKNNQSQSSRRDPLEVLGAVCICGDLALCLELLILLALCHVQNVSRCLPLDSGCLASS